MTANKDGLIFAVPNRTSLQDPLIDVINDKGELLYSFGETLKFKHDWNQLNQANLCTNSDGDLLVAFRYWPIVRKYSPQGKLLAEYNIEHPYMKSLEKENIKKANMSSEKDKKGGYWLLNLAIQAKENGFFLLHKGVPVEIIEFNYVGKLINDYWFALHYQYFARDFIIRDYKKTKCFLILQTNPENEINAFIYEQKRRGNVKQSIN